MPSSIIPPNVTGNQLRLLLQNMKRDILQLQRLTPLVQVPHGFGLHTTVSPATYPSGSWQAFTTPDSQVLRGGVTYNATTGEYTVPMDGVYQLSAGVAFAANATGYRGVFIGGIYDETFPGSTAVPGFAKVDVARFLSAGSVVSPSIRQQSGGALALDVTSGFNYVSITRIGN